VLHRKLVALGIENVVICPQNWDERGKGVKTDPLDALAMVGRLDQYVNGHRRALAVVRVPTEAEEQARWVSRLREQVRRHRQRLEAQGRCLLLTQGIRVSGRWWQAARWEVLAAPLPAALVAVLTVTRDLAQAAHERVEALTAQLEAVADPVRPRGLGGLTREVLRREMGDWKRCTNRRQVASLTGLCPRVYSSNQTVRMGSISKHGNPRLRHALVELAWRVVIWQPQYPPVARWRSLLLDRKAPKSGKKKAIVAIARRLAIDLWRLETGRCRAETLGLVMIG
jgi:transposase